MQQNALFAELSRLWPHLDHDCKEVILVLVWILVRDAVASALAQSISDRYAKKR